MFYCEWCGTQQKPSIQAFVKQYSGIWPTRNEVSGVMAECYLDWIVQQYEAADA
ncbi:hypothetical protein PSYAE_16791 [Pseudomonas amygdali pv. aesculi str. 0893_23]|nr:hypothetical protein PSYAE_16791 [Pseudomonas amygdali pv. aesculi str. 0893_23]